MKTIKNFSLVVVSILIILYTGTAFIISDPSADFELKELSIDDRISLAKVSTQNSRIGMFKSAVQFSQNPADLGEMDFYGQEIIISDNPNIDKILIGIKSNNNTRIELWNRGELMESRDKGFSGKMSWGATQSMAVQFYDQSNEKYKGKSTISLRFFEGTGFLSDIGQLSFDLTPYGNLSGEKTIGVFAMSLASEQINRPLFSNLEIWKNFQSFD